MKMITVISVKRCTEHTMLQPLLWIKAQVVGARISYFPMIWFEVPSIVLHVDEHIFFLSGNIEPMFCIRVVQYHSPLPIPSDVFTQRTILYGASIIDQDALGLFPSASRASPSSSLSLSSHSPSCGTVM
jgi:hypothetical protein